TPRSSPRCRRWVKPRRLSNLPDHPPLQLLEQWTADCHHVQDCGWGTPRQNNVGGRPTSTGTVSSNSVQAGAVRLWFSPHPPIARDRSGRMGCILTAIRTHLSRVWPQRAKECAGGSAVDQ